MLRDHGAQPIDATNVPQVNAPFGFREAPYEVGLWSPSRLSLITAYANNVDSLYTT